MVAKAKRRHWCTLRKGLFAGAIEDFTVAVEQAPFFADGWKRRGQARSALGHTTEALEVQPQHLFVGLKPHNVVVAQMQSGVWRMPSYRERLGRLHMSAGLSHMMQADV